MTEKRLTRRVPIMVDPETRKEIMSFKLEHGFKNPREVWRFLIREYREAKKKEGIGNGEVR